MLSTFSLWRLTVRPETPHLGNTLYFVHFQPFLLLLVFLFCFSIFCHVYSCSSVKLSTALFSAQGKVFIFFLFHVMPVFSLLWLHSMYLGYAAFLLHKIPAAILRSRFSHRFAFFFTPSRLLLHAVCLCFPPVLVFHLGKDLFDFLHRSSPAFHAPAF